MGKTWPENLTSQHASSNSVRPPIGEAERGVEPRDIVFRKDVRP